MARKKVKPRKPATAFGSPGRHGKVEVEFPDWFDALGPNEACLRSVAEDVYVAKALAEAYGAFKNAQCVQLIRAGTKSLAILEQSGASQGKRCAAGERAARKFWEAKVCARRL